VTYLELEQSRTLSVHQLHEHGLERKPTRRSAGDLNRRESFAGATDRLDEKVAVCNVEAAPSQLELVGAGSCGVALAELYRYVSFLKRCRARLQRPDDRPN